MTTEELIKEAKARYPPGTYYKLAHLHDEYDIIQETDIWITNGDSIYVKKERLTKDGYTPCVYYRGKWAEIVGKNITEITNQSNQYIYY